MDHKKWIAVMLAIVMALSLGACVQETAQEPTLTQAPTETEPVKTLPDDLTAECGSWLLDTVPEAGYGSAGGEWVILGLARSGVQVPGGYFEDYFEKVAAYTAQMGGVLHEKKYTEYSRVILAVTAIGKDPTDVGGFDLLLPLADYEQTIFQGINGPVFALLALDSGDYEIPENVAGGTQATRELYVDYILSAECPGGGWTLAGAEADVDITAMALQALAKYQDRQDVMEATERALTVLSQLQNDEGGYTAYGYESSESIAQVITALAELGIGMDDPRFVKNGNTLKDRLLDFMEEDGSFRHLQDGDTDLIATEQAFYALVALERREQGKTTLYDMSDVR